MNHQHNVRAYNLNVPEATVELNYINQCPVCKDKMQPEYIHGVLCYEFREYILNVLHYCPGCNSAFFVKYLMSVIGSGPRAIKLSATNRNSMFPNIHAPQNFDAKISGISHTFVKIYNQSLQAESEGLDQISGIGYRKALEYLMKDYLILENPEKVDIISHMNLGKCIQEFIASPELKIVAQRAAWLGNDHTHYVQKYSDKDIHDLKRMIDLTVHWILFILGTREAETIEKQ